MPLDTHASSHILYFITKAVIKSKNITIKNSFFCVVLLFGLGYFLERFVCVCVVFFFIFVLFFCCCCSCFLKKKTKNHNKNKRKKKEKKEAFKKYEQKTKKQKGRIE
jgi:hypothetical protein